jgi:hypothetical protein
MGEQPMRNTNRVLIAGLIVAALPLAGCGKKASSYTKVEPAQVEHPKDSQITRITLTEQAMERLGVKTTPIQEGKVQGAENAPPRPFVPDSAVMYVASGETYVYTSPNPRTFVRQPVDIDYIQGGLAVLKKGPPTGTQVVTVGAAELFGTEFGVGH